MIEQPESTPIGTTAPLERARKTDPNPVHLSDSLNSAVPVDPVPESTAASEDVNFTKEDIVLYVFVLLLMIFIGAFFWTTQTRLERNLLQERDVLLGKTEYKTDPIHLYDSYLATQEFISAKRYHYGARILVMNSTRKNTGFMVGTMISLLGCIMVIRRIRKMPITADFAALDRAKLRVATGSPGLFVTLMGCILIFSTIVRYDSFDLQDALIQPPGSYSVSQRGTSETDDPTIVPTPSATEKQPVLTNEEQKKLEELLRQRDQILQGSPKK